MAWYNTSWLDRVKITVDHTKVGANQTNFPVYVNLANLPAGFFSNVRTDGGDIRITQSDGTTELAREVVAIDTTAKTGELHFNGNSLSSTVDTIFYIYFNNPSATEPAANATYGKYNVWDSNFLYVGHFQGNSNDSTSNQFNGTDTAMTYGTAYQKLSGQGASLNGTTSQIDLGTSSTLNPTAVTVEGWGYITSLAQAYNSFIQRYAASIVPYQLMVKSNGLLAMFFDATTRISYDGTGSHTLSINTYYYLVGAYDSTNGLAAYVNGASDKTVAANGNLALSSTAHTLFGNDDIDASRFWPGYMDEVRISKIARSSTWISTQYNNQNSPSTFYSVGAQEALPSLGGTLSLMGVG